MTLGFDEFKVPFSDWKPIPIEQERFKRIWSNFHPSNVGIDTHAEIVFEEAFVLPIEGDYVVLGAFGTDKDAKKHVVLDANGNGLLQDETGYEVIGELPITVKVKFRDQSFRPINLCVSEGQYSFQCGYFFPAEITLLGETREVAVLPSGLVFLDEDKDGIFEKHCSSNRTLSFGGHFFLVTALMGEAQLLLKPSVSEPVDSGYPAPDLKALILDTNDFFDLKKTSFQTVILGFCPPGCSGSRISFPALKRLANELDGSNSVAFFAVLSQSEDAIRIKTQFDFYPRFLIGNDHYSDWQIKTTPVFFVVNKDGSIRERIEGGSESIDNRLRPYLMQEQPSRGVPIE